MILHEHEKEFRDAITSTAQNLKIREDFIEKDYWVTYVLKNLYNSKFKDTTVFKGGTSLSKAYNLINRFSEDVDLAITDKKEKTNNKIKSELKNIEKDICCLPLVKNKKNTGTTGSNLRKSTYSYKKYSKNDKGALKKDLVIEINSFTKLNSDDYCKKLISTYIEQNLSQTNTDLIKKYKLEKFEINVLHIERTFVEKILCLTRLSCEDNGQSQLNKKIRHFYDIHKIFQSNVKKYTNFSNVKKYFNNALEDDLANPDCSGTWNNVNFIQDTQLFTNLGKIFNELKEPFKNELTALLFEEEKVLLEDIKNSFKILINKWPKIPVNHKK